MKSSCVLLLLCLTHSSLGVADDFQVEQYSSPFVANMDQGTHMSSDRMHSQSFQGFNRHIPMASTSRQEMHQEERYVNGQPSYERKYERRYQNGELIHEDGYETGDRNRGAGGYGANAALGGSSSSSWSSSSSYGSNGGVNSYGSTGGGGMYKQDRLQQDIQRLRQRLHQGNALPRPAVTSSSHHEEKNEESHFVNGQQVYGRNEERRFENGHLVRNVSEEHGNPTGVGFGSVNSNSNVASTRGILSTSAQQIPIVSTSYYRPGSERRRVTSNQRRVSATSVDRPGFIGSNSFNSGPQSSGRTQVSGRTRSSQESRRGQGYNSRRPTGPRFNQVNSDGTVRQGNIQRSRTQSRVYQTQGQGSSMSNKPSPTEHEPRRYPGPIHRPISNTFGSAGYVASSDTTSQTNSGVVDTYSEPYNYDRSPSYQPDRTPNRPNNEPRVTSHSVESESSSRQSHHRVNPTTNVALESVSHQVDDEEETFTFSPGFLFNEDANSISSSGNRGEQTSDSSSYSSSSSHSYSEASADKRDGIIAASPGDKIDLSIAFNVGEGDSVHLRDIGNSDRSDVATPTDSDLSSSSSEHSIGIHQGNYNDRRESQYSQNSLNYGQTLTPVTSGFETVQTSNRTTNTMTSRIQPLISSYKVETRTSRSYLNGKFVSETKYYTYYENGVLIHSNQTQRSRDEMETEGVNVNALDLSFDDLARYGISNPDTIPMSHSQRFEMTQEKEFVNGDQVYESTHERHFQDGELVHEDHNEKDSDQLVSVNSRLPNRALNPHGSSAVNNERVYQTQYNVGGVRTSGSEASSSSSAYNERTRPIHVSGIGQGVVVSVSPRTITRKTEVRSEQEFKDGEQVYDLHHEKKYEDGQLIDENLVERGPEDLEVLGHRDRLSDILSGSTLNTASQSSYRNVQYDGSQHPRQYPTHSSNSANSGTYYESTNSGNTNVVNTLNTEVSQENDHLSTNVNSASNTNNGMIGNNLINSNSLTSVIGGGGVHTFESLNTAQALNEGSVRPNVPGGYYMTNGGSGSGYGGANYANQGGTTGYSSQSSFSSGYLPNGEVHRHETEQEEHFQDGRLVTGREEEREWKNNDLIKNDVRRYGEGRESQSVSSPENDSGFASTSSFQSSIGSSSGSGGMISASHGGGAGYSGASGQENSQSYGGGSYSSSAGRYHEGDNSASLSLSSNAYGTGSSAEFAAGGLAGAGGLGGSHRREMEFEEHYENGQLVRGRKEDKEWRDRQLIRHDEDHYGEGASSTSLRNSAFQNSDTGACSSQPCHNGGSCISGGRGYICLCSFGFRGTTCREAYCPRWYCRNGGTCSIGPDSTQHCSCPSTHTGPRCELAVRTRGGY